MPQATYKAKCAMCHGADGKGKANIPDLTSDKVKKASDAELEDFIANGGPAKKATHALRQQGRRREGDGHLYPFAEVLMRGRGWANGCRSASIKDVSCVSPQLLSEK